MDEQLRDYILEARVDAQWADASLDPCELAEQAEQDLIMAFGVNRAGVRVS